jgi:hypothetical protein
LPSPDSPDRFFSSSNIESGNCTFIDARPVTPFANQCSKPPHDYVCKLCSTSGHWIKDCRLYQPRMTSSLKSFGASSFSSGTSLSSSARNSNPPMNYICRLCNVSGHWIDQCSKFQPKALAPINDKISFMPPGMGPTPNYRPPAYLSKPVPGNYLCNLCNRPGHWIQQCSQFSPIIRRNCS